jgi:hypothetical protein
MQKHVLAFIADVLIALGRENTKADLLYTDPGEVPHIMISYEWDAKPLVLKVRDYLKVGGYRVWVDIDSMEGSTIHAMAEAVEKSAVVLMCMSHRYKESQNCRSGKNLATDGLRN